VLTHGALGGFAAAFPGIARQLGASRVVGTIGPSKLGPAAVTRLPYDQIVDSSRLPDVLAGEKFDVIIDPVATRPSPPTSGWKAARSTAASSLRLMRGHDRAPGRLQGFARVAGLVPGFVPVIWSVPVPAVRFCVGLELGTVPADLLPQVRLLGLQPGDAPPDLGVSASTFSSCWTAAQCGPRANRAARAGSSVLHPYARIRP